MAKKKLRIFFYITSQDGVAYYRMFKPAQTIQRLGLADVVMNPYSSTRKVDSTWVNLEPSSHGRQMNSELLASVLGKPEKPNVDVVIFQRADTLGMFSLAQAIREMYHIPVLQETDDYVFDVPGTNPGRLSYYEKKVEHQASPDEPMIVARISLGTFDGYVVSTPFLKDFYSNFSPTYLCPNAIVPSERPNLQKKPHKDFRLMFSSSAGHADGLKMLFPVIDTILTQYPNVTFYQYGGLPNLFIHRPYRARVKMMKWKPPEVYWKYINSLSPDICLAPLSDRLFNRAKSNLRLLEYWTAGENAVIASPVAPYKSTIVHKKNGMLAKNADEWIDAIELLMKDTELRTTLGVNGRKTVEKDYNLELHARSWVAAAEHAVRHYTPNRLPPAKYLSPS